MPFNVLKVERRIHYQSDYPQGSPADAHRNPPVIALVNVKNNAAC